MGDDDMDPLLTKNEAAAFLRVTPNTIARWVRDGRLPVLYTPGRNPRFRLRDLLAAEGRIRRVGPLGKDLRP